MIWLILGLAAGALVLGILGEAISLYDRSPLGSRRLERVRIEDSARVAEHQLYLAAQRAFGDMLEAARDAGSNESQRR